MQLIVPGYVEDLGGLSIAACVTGLVLGFCLWLLGWWGHRFWIVLFTTVVGGLAGLATGRVTGVQPFVAGLLLAVAAGAMALSLARVLAFVAGGIAGLLLMGLVPAWHVPVISFLIGGLAGLVLFREWTMALTSLAGTLLMGYSGILLADRLGRIDGADFAQRRTLLLNALCWGLACLGLALQFLLDRWRIHRSRLLEAEGEIQRAEEELEHRYRHRAWWWRWSDRWRYRRAA